MKKFLAMGLSVFLMTAGLANVSAEVQKPQYQIPVTAEMCETRYPASSEVGALSNAFDNGASKNKWQDGKKDGWLKIDFGVPVKIETYDLETSGVDQAVRKAKLEVSDTGEDGTWETVDVIDNVNPDTNVVYVDTLLGLEVDTPRLARYYRINFQESANWGTNILEIRFFSSELYDIARNKNIVFDSKNGWNAATETVNCALDGDYKTKWSSGGSAADRSHAMVVDLGKYYDIRKWFMANGQWGGEVGTTNTKAFTLEYLKADPEGGNEWQTFFAYDKEEVRPAYGGIVDGVYARYIKINISNPAIGGANGCRIYDFELFGEALPAEKQTALLSNAMEIARPADLTWDQPKNFKAASGTLQKEDETGAVIFDYIGSFNDAYINYRFAYPSEWRTANAQALEFKMENMAVDGARSRDTQIILEDGDGESYEFTICLLPNGQESVYEIPVSSFRLMSGEKDGLLDMANVKYANIRILSNLKDSGSNTGRTTLRSIQLKTGYPVEVSSLVRYEKAENGGYRDITLSGLESGDIRVSGEIKNIGTAAKSFVIVPVLYEKSNLSAPQVKMQDLISVSGLEGGQKQVFAKSINVPQTGDYEIRLFIWDGIQKLMPITECSSIG